MRTRERARGEILLPVRDGTGDWDNAAALIDRFLEGQEGHYQAASVHGFRALLRIARSDLDGARSDAERALMLARPAKDPQIVLTISALAAFAFLVAGDEARGGETLDEALAGLREVREIGFAAVESHMLAWVARALGRPEDFLEAVGGRSSDSPWLKAANAIAAGDFRAGADILEEMGLPARAAFFRLRAAEQLVAEGRRAEADEQLRPALAFYRSVRATRFIREGEALLAASA